MEVSTKAMTNIVNQKIRQEFLRNEYSGIFIFSYTELCACRAAHEDALAAMMKQVEEHLTDMDAAINQLRKSRDDLSALVEAARERRAKDASRQLPQPSSATAAQSGMSGPSSQLSQDVSNVPVLRALTLGETCDFLDDVVAQYARELTLRRRLFALLPHLSGEEGVRDGREDLQRLLAVWMEQTCVPDQHNGRVDGMRETMRTEASQVMT
ncbi:unnamed protein product [Vitrella brassicaformis CCMP3155]|uniref:Uncharacterized protein n=1 Tax=Vitrella brassicaformis (strain CCMP3155) TaxID=1169540 RepID=A0A0G4FKQ5_VITBC|nr:unnamed protein product [Vitrella brassicaformis CCMP3155]|eukprot:CEM14525.1 unnamed protein product [Vitrella brassicaformis CCMP3155]